MVASLFEEVAIGIFPPQKQKSGTSYDCVKSFIETDQSGIASLSAAVHISTRCS